MSSQHIEISKILLLIAVRFTPEHVTNTQGSDTSTFFRCMLTWIHIQHKGTVIGVEALNIIVVKEREGCGEWRKCSWI